MPPKDKDPPLKQKTLHGFFSKQQGDSKPKPSPAKAPEVVSKPSQFRAAKPNATPPSKSVERSTKNNYTSSSSPANASRLTSSSSYNARSTPLTSTPNVTMISEDEDEQDVVLSTQVVRTNIYGFRSPINWRMCSLERSVNYWSMMTSLPRRKLK
ncbi:uncharacterized protein EI90DRAFT_793038 [Cantharellus anzutake]|uniref:uncharacterized protein n=1 Tax=Cantharellus anzutake TaxID=1750568 RepID=UPI001905F42A|nr:uncharacterized protein EI90DRAFT_793038 [Cantharellus anzutake]KAF8342826.1 hypothetical protein EI90DRAFT_793038 [Cantharellus anzutake]